MRKPQEPAPQMLQEVWRTRRVALLRRTRQALLVALTLVLSWLESFLPPPPVPVPLRYGLSNLAVQYGLYFGGLREAWILTGFKVVFVFLLRGPVAASLSAAGGLLSVAAVWLGARIWGERISYLLLSVLGAMVHNLAQYGLVSFLFVGPKFWILYPMLLFISVATGALTASLFRLLVGALRQAGGVDLRV